MLVRIDPYYHPTTRERYFQELVRAQRDADRIARKRRLERKRWRREHLYPWLLAIAAGICVLIGIIDWEAVW